jgi:hypothetical protein
MYLSVETNSHGKLQKCVGGEGRERESEGDITEEHVVLQDFAHKVGFVISIAATAERGPRRIQLRTAVFRMAASSGEAAG